MSKAWKCANWLETEWYTLQIMLWFDKNTLPRRRWVAHTETRTDSSGRINLDCKCTPNDNRRMPLQYTFRQYTFRQYTFRCFVICFFPVIKLWVHSALFGCLNYFVSEKRFTGSLESTFLKWLTIRWEHHSLMVVCSSLLVPQRL